MWHKGPFRSNRSENFVAQCVVYFAPSHVTTEPLFKLPTKGGGLPGKRREHISGHCNESNQEFLDQPHNVWSMYQSCDVLAESEAKAHT